MHRPQPIACISTVVSRDGHAQHFPGVPSFLPECSPDQKALKYVGPRSGLNALLPGPALSFVDSVWVVDRSFTEWSSDPICALSPLGPKILVAGFSLTNAGSSGLPKSLA